MEEERQARRRALQERKQVRAEESLRNIAQGNPGDVDFIGLVRQWRADNCPSACSSESDNITSIINALFIIV